MGSPCIEKEGKGLELCVCVCVVVVLERADSYNPCWREWNLPGRCSDSLCQQTKRFHRRAPPAFLRIEPVTIDKRAHCPESFVQKFQGVAVARQRRGLSAGVRPVQCNVML